MRCFKPKTRCVGSAGTVLLVYADVPLLQTATLRRLLDAHHAAGAAATVLTARLDNPSGYGRIVRDGSGALVRIVEERDASPDERALKEINSGIYAFQLEPLFDALRRLPASERPEGVLPDRSDRELPPAGAPPRNGRRRGCRRTCGVSTAASIWRIWPRALRERKNREVMLSGVTLEDPSTTFDRSGGDDRSGHDHRCVACGSRAGPSIGQRCHVHAGARLTNAIAGDDVTVLDYSVIVSSTLEAGAPWVRSRMFVRNRSSARVRTSGTLSS